MSPVQGFLLNYAVRGRHHSGGLPCKGNSNRAADLDLSLDGAEEDLQVLAEALELCELIFQKSLFRRRPAAGAARARSPAVIDWRISRSFSRVTWTAVSTFTRTSAIAAMLP